MDRQDKKLRGIATYGPKQSLTSLRVSKDALAEHGIELELFHLPRRRLKHWRTTYLQDIRFLWRLWRGSYDFLILNSGVVMMGRPATLAAALRIARAKRIALLALWRNAGSKFDEMRERIGSARYERSVRLIQSAPIAHMAISRQTADDVHAAIGSTRPVVIGNCQAVPVNYLAPVPPQDPPIVLNVASVMHRKRPDLFVEIAAKVLQLVPEARFEWVGGEATPEIERQIADLGLTEKIRFIGHVDDPYPFMQRASLFLLTSEEEGFGLVLAEAMACSRTVAAFSGTGAAEVPGDTGLILDSDDPAGAAQAIAAEISKPQAERVNAAARQRYLDLYSPAAYAARLAGVIHGGSPNT